MSLLNESPKMPHKSDFLLYFAANYDRWRQSGSNLSSVNHVPITDTKMPKYNNENENSLSNDVHN